MITLVVAHDRNRAIGRDNTIPWDVPEDLRIFQRETNGGALVMGRRTWDSLPTKPLPRRMNCVVSRDRSIAETVVPSVEDAVQASRAAGYDRIYGIGGAGIYEAMLPVADRLLITEVDLDVEGADAWFPAFAEDDWREVHRRVIRASAPRCTLRELLRLRP